MKRNRFIDVLKGILIIFVIFFHFPFKIAGVSQYLFPFHIFPIPCFMMISGYVSALSFQKRGCEDIKKTYKFIPVAEKVLRFTIPFTIAFIGEWIVFRIFGIYKVGIRTYGIFALAMDYLRGGIGQGSYYYPLMIQFIFIIPIIYYVIKKHNFKGLIYCFFANAAYEILKTAYHMNDSEYRMLVFRYIFIIGAGCYIAIGQIPPKKKIIPLSVICIIAGLGFAYLFSYTTYTPKIITYWGGSSFLVCLLTIPILGWLIQHVHCTFKPLEIIGQASFNIFLVQMIFYNFANDINEMIPVLGVQLLFCIVSCVVIGILFYYLEQPLTKFVIRKMKEKMLHLDK